MGLANSTNRLDWDRVCRYRRGKSRSDSNATITGTAETAALLFLLEKGGVEGVLETQDYGERSQGERGGVKS